MDRVRVRIDGEEHVYEVRPVDLVRAERKLGSIEAKPLESSFFIAWSAAHRKGDKRSYEAWLEDVESADVEDDDEAPLEPSDES